MRKLWWWGGSFGLVGALLAALLVTGVVKLPGAGAKAKADARIDTKTQSAKTERKGEKDKKPEVPLEFNAGEVVQPSWMKLTSAVDFSGPLVAPQTAVVRAKTGGTLLALTVAEGSRVTAGQVLGRIDMADMGSRLAERSAMTESARATLAQAERSHANNERLAQQQFISGSALDTSRASLDMARAQLGAAQAALETTRGGLRDASLVAPIAGIVAKRHVLPGEKVSPEQQVLTIVDLARLELAGMVGTHEVARLLPGTAVSVRVEGLATPVPGRIARIAPAAEPGTRSIGVTIALNNPGETLRAGQYAVARADLSDSTERLTLPVAAVGNTSGQDHVWVIEGGLLARRAVSLGRRDERQGRVEVLHGVLPQTQVLAARFDNLREGAKASVVAVQATPGSVGRPAVVASAAASAPALVK